jgi:hypothetical protein
MDHQSLITTLRRVSTATITTTLLKKGLRNVWMRGSRPIQPGQPRLVGPAFALRNVRGLFLERYLEPATLKRGRGR